MIFSSFGVKSSEFNSHDYLESSCSQISYNEFLVNSDNSDSCILWGYVNVKGKIQIDIETYETDTKVYAWWTTGQFLMKTPIQLLENPNNLLSIPRSKRARLNVKVVCGSAKVILRQINKKSNFKN